MERYAQIVDVWFPSGDRDRMGDTPEKFDERDPDIRGEVIMREQSRDDVRRRRGNRRRESLVQHGVVEVVERGLRAAGSAEVRAARCAGVSAAGPYAWPSELQSISSSMRPWFHRVP